MRLAPRLAITFGFLAIASTALLGFAVRARLADGETRRFEAEVEGVCDRLLGEVERQGEADQKLISGACSGGELVDRIVIEANRGELDEHRTRFSVIVPEERRAFDVDELVLAMQGGDIIGASPSSLLGLPAKEVDQLLVSSPKRYTIRTTNVPAIVSRCTKPTDSGRLVGLVAARNLDGVLDRVARATTFDVKVQPSWTRATMASPPKPPPATSGKRRGGKADAAKGDAGALANASASASAGAGAASGAGAGAGPGATEAATVRTTCKLEGEGGTLTFDVLKSTRELDDKLRDVDNAIAVAAAISAAITIFVGTILGLRLGRPLSILATEAGKVAAGEARPIDVRGSGEEKELARAFDRMIQDLAVTRRRLAAASRVAAWREVARRVAHEVKNPLAPIRAAVETLRRLRAREDPRFDEYFDEATRTVLDEVHRISNIVTEFTRFARLPPPRPTALDAAEVAKHVIQVHAAAAEGVNLVHAAAKPTPTVQADRDQVIQVLTNLVQNALDAVKGVDAPTITITTDTDGHYVSLSVVDNGPGIAPEIAARLFEPYATTKAHGTGLGLAIAQRIALEHNGELSYMGPGPRGRGCTFRLLLPIEGPPPMSEVPSSDGPSAEA